MDKIEEVKKILDNFFKDSHNTYPSPKTAELAHEINQLYEPQPDQSSRLLTEKETWVMEVTNNIERSASRDEVLNIAKAVARAQLAIDIEHRNWIIAEMRKESQARIEALIKE